MSQMTHLKEKSHYNHNFYKCGNTSAEILETCDEDYETCHYYIVDGEDKTLLGCGKGDGFIELLTHY